MRTLMSLALAISLFFCITQVQALGYLLSLPYLEGITPLGIAASLGICGFLLSFIYLKEQKKRKAL